MLKNHINLCVAILLHCEEIIPVFFKSAVIIVISQRNAGTTENSG